MSGKDFLKLLLCLYEYDTNIEIELVRNYFGEPGYEITAENKRTLDIYHGFDENLMSAMYSIVNYMNDIREDAKNMVMEYEEGEPEDDGHSTDPDLAPRASLKWAFDSVKNVLDDNYRAEMRKKWIAETKERKEYNEFFKDVDAETDRTMPCRNGKCTERVWRDDVINDNCELHYRMCCPILLKHMADVDEMRRKRNEEWKEYKNGKQN